MQNPLTPSKDSRDLVEFWFKFVGGIGAAILAILGFNSALTEFRNQATQKLFERQLDACAQAAHAAENMSNASVADFEAKLDAFGAIKHGELFTLTDQGVVTAAVHVWNAGVAILKGLPPLEGMATADRESNRLVSQAATMEHLPELQLALTRSCRDLISSEMRSGLRMEDVELHYREPVTIDITEPMKSRAASDSRARNADPGECRELG
jgi:hypothetical protein